MAKYFDTVHENVLNGRLNTADGILYGICNGFHVLVSLRQNIRIKFGVSGTEEAMEDLKSYFAQQIASGGLMENDSFLDRHEMNISVRTSGKAEIDGGRVDTIIKNVTIYLSQQSLTDCCPVCGSPETELLPVEIKGTPAYICRECFNRFGESAREAKERIQKEGSRIIPGTLGGIIGLLAGTVCWVVLRNEFYAFAAIIITVLLIVSLYKVFSKGIDKRGAVICWVLSFIAILAGPYIGWAYDAYASLKEYDYTFGECARYLFEIISVSELTGAFITDVVLTVLAGGLSAFLFIRSALNDRFGETKLKLFQK